MRGSLKERTIVAREDHQTSFVPIWFGYPKSATFEAQFRLIDGKQIRQLSNTGSMRGSRYRYACVRDVQAGTATRLTR